MALLGVLTSLALILSYVEAVLPPILTIAPGIKLGFPNILIIFILYRMGTLRAAAVSFVRIILCNTLAICAIFAILMRSVYLWNTFSDNAATKASRMVFC